MSFHGERHCLIHKSIMDSSIHPFFSMAYRHIVGDLVAPSFQSVHFFTFKNEKWRQYLTTHSPCCRKCCPLGFRGGRLHVNRLHSFLLPRSFVVVQKRDRHLIRVQNMVWIHVVNFLLHELHEIMPHLFHDLRTLLCGMSPKTVSKSGTFQKPPNNLFSCTYCFCTSSGAIFSVTFCTA